MCINAPGTTVYTFFGVQYGDECFCGTKPGRHLDTPYGTSTPSDESKCGVLCWGNINQVCGGFMTNSVYEINYAGDSAGTSAKTCRAGQYKCTIRHQCIDASFYCDGGTPDCDDATDEKGCTPVEKGWSTPLSSVTASEATSTTVVSSTSSMYDSTSTPAAETTKQSDTTIACPSKAILAFKSPAERTRGTLANRLAVIQAVATPQQCAIKCIEHDTLCTDTECKDFRCTSFSYKESQLKCQLYKASGDASELDEFHLEFVHYARVCYDPIALVVGDDAAAQPTKPAVIYTTTIATAEPTTPAPTTTVPATTAPPTTTTTAAPTTTDVCPSGYTPNPAFGGLQYLGCYMDDPARDLPYLKGRHHTADTCSDACVSYVFFSVQDKDECWCGRRYATKPQYARRDETECPNQMGGGYRNSVFTRNTVACVETTATSSLTTTTGTTTWVVNCCCYLLLACAAMIFARRLVKRFPFFVLISMHIVLASYCTGLPPPPRNQPLPQPLLQRGSSTTAAT